MESRPEPAVAVAAVVVVVVGELSDWNGLAATRELHFLEVRQQPELFQH